MSINLPVISITVTNRIDDGERGAQRAPGTHRAADAASREILFMGRE